MNLTSFLLRSLSEPFAIDAISYMYQRGEIDREEVRMLMKSAVKLLAKTEPGSKTERVVFKLDGYTNTSIGILKELFPKVKFIISTRYVVHIRTKIKKQLSKIYIISFSLFSQRHPTPSVKSFGKVFAIFKTGMYKMLGIGTSLV